MADQRPVLIFGMSDLASVIAFYLRHDLARNVAGFVVDRAYLRTSTFDGMPVVAFDEAVEAFPPEEHEMLLPLGWTGMNRMRRERMQQARALGYPIGRFISPSARVAAGADPGDNACIGEGSIVGPYCRVGENVQMRTGVVMSHHVTVEDDCFVGSGATAGGRVHIGARCVIGMGAVLRSGVQVGEGCFIGAGAVVVGDTEPDGLYVGCPARRMERSPLDAAGRMD